MSTVEKLPIEFGQAGQRRQHLYVVPPSVAGLGQTAKRVLDSVAAAIALVLLAPLLVAVAIAIRLHDGGPAVFRQQRVGLNGRPFTMYKFRTMVVGAEHMRFGLEHMNKCDGPIFKLDDDPRVTPLGRVLRVTSIDELPQLVNVLRGDMSMVGPRPALPREVDRFGPRLLVRHRMRPGITGLWQAYARDDNHFSAYERLDLEYVFGWSLLLDLKIMVKTATSVPARALRMATSGRSDRSTVAVQPLEAVAD